MVWRVLIAVMLMAAIGSAAFQSSTQSPALGKLVEGVQLVSGKAMPGSGPVVIYDISFPVRTKIGVAKTVADDGSFSSAVKPPLVKGHQIVAVDKDGNESAAVTVSASSGSPTPAPQ